MWVEFLINKAIPVGEWNAKAWGEDVVSVDIGEGERRMWIVCAYVPGLGNVNGEQTATLCAVKTSLEDAEGVIFVGDFNLHHARRAGDQVSTADSAARGLIQLIDSYRIQLTTPIGATIWRGSRSPGATIDVAFLSAKLYADSYAAHCATYWTKWTITRSWERCWKVTRAVRRQQHELEAGKP